MRLRHKGNTVFTRRGGFTLVEVIVAMALLSISLMATFAVLHRCANAAHHAHCLSEAALMAERLMNEVRLGDRAQYHQLSGQESHYTWQVQVAPTPLDNLGAVCITIEWLEQNRAQQFELLSLIKMNILGG